MASAAVPSSRSFTALNGTEVKRAIIADITNQLERDTRFSHHLSYAAISWRWKLACDVYPKEIGNFEIQSGATLHPSTARPLEPEEQPIAVDLEGSREVTAGFAPEGQSADSVRRDTGQPLHTTKTVTGPAGERITVDSPQVPNQPRESKEVPRAKRSETNVPGGKGILARRTTIKTAAAPDGVEVAPIPGTPQTEEDGAKIIEDGLRDGTLQKAEE